MNAFHLGVIVTAIALVGCAPEGSQAPPSPMAERGGGAAGSDESGFLQSDEDKALEEEEWQAAGEAEPAAGTFAVETKPEGAAVFAPEAPPALDPMAQPAPPPKPRPEPILDVPTDAPISGLESNERSAKVRRQPATEHSGSATTGADGQPGGALGDALNAGWHDSTLGPAVRQGFRGKDHAANGRFDGNGLGLVDKEVSRDKDDEITVLDESYDVDERTDDGKKQDESSAHRERDRRYARGALALRSIGDDPSIYDPPETTLPRFFYFENTYLGGSAAYAERLRRLKSALDDDERPYEIVQAEVQPFDPPRSRGLDVVATVDASHIERPRRVFLQVGLQGSARYGWRRPPLDVVLVVDQPALARGLGFVKEFVIDLLGQLKITDRLGIVLAGRETSTFLEVSRLRAAQQHLVMRIDELAAIPGGGSDDLARAMREAGDMLQAASDDDATIPGTKTVLVLSGEQDQTRIGHAAGAAHDLTVQACVTSVFAVDAERSEWWQVADAGYGNLHRVTTERFAAAIDEEMKSIARVVARLVRVNVRLGKNAKAIRVLGTRVLDQREVEAVKAREVATDQNLSRSLGIASDRGEDDDGIQTVIPYFYGDDSHVIMIELWVEGPGVVADVTVKYKDMVNLNNATARTSVRLGSRPQPPTHDQLIVARNVRGFQLAENLQRASHAVRYNDYRAAVDSLDAAAEAATQTNDRDSQAVEGLRQMVERGDWRNNPARRATLQETLLISGQRRVGDTNADE